MTKQLYLLGNDLLNLFFPRLCPACGAAGLPDHSTICLDCQVNLPFTNYHALEENPFTARFWGRLPIERGAAMFAFSKKGRVQRLLHQLKYKGRKDIGMYLGRVYGQSLLSMPAYREVSLILPVPLHWRRLRERGYNQSACFAQGLSEAMGVPWSDQHLRRRQHTSTQTKKSRMERFENVDGAFELCSPHLLEGKAILLVDDVLTTGATLEACGSELLKLTGVRLSLATIAIATD